MPRHRLLSSKMSSAWRNINIRSICTVPDVLLQRRERFQSTSPVLFCPWRDNFMIYVMNCSELNLTGSSCRNLLIYRLNPLLPFETSITFITDVEDVSSVTMIKWRLRREVAAGSSALWGVSMHQLKHPNSSSGPHHGFGALRLILDAVSVSNHRLWCNSLQHMWGRSQTKEAEMEMTQRQNVSTQWKWLRQKVRSNTEVQIWSFERGLIN